MLKPLPSALMDIHPWNSVLQNNECEAMACSLLRTMHRLGDKWELPTYEQYVEYRRSLGSNYDIESKQQYDKIIPYLKSVDTAVLFSDSWKRAVDLLDS